MMHPLVDDVLGSLDLSCDPELRAIAELAPDALRRRWRSLVGGPIPAGLGRSLILRILAYRSQAQRYGDLDLASQRALSASLTGQPSVAELPPDPPGISVSDAVGQGPTGGVRGRRASKGPSATISIASPGHCARATACRLHAPCDGAGRWLRLERPDL